MKAVERNITWQYIQFHLDKSDKEIQKELAEKRFVNASLSTIRKYHKELSNNTIQDSELVDNKVQAKEVK